MTAPAAITAESLRRMPLPSLDDDADKDARGRVLIVGGAVENPGGLLLAAEAAIRAGAGKLQLATADAIAPLVAIAVPEARVFALPASGSDGLDRRGAPDLAEKADRVNALLIGPGLVDEDAAGRFTREVLRRIEKPAVVLDAGGLAALREDPDALARLEGRAVLTPHAGEMAQLLGVERDDIAADPVSAARRAVERFGAVVALKGAETVIAAPDGSLLRYDGGGVGLATSGSGDVLGGIVCGLLARGANPLCAAAWGVFLHGEAGNALAARYGAVGFLARELPGEVPRILHRVFSTQEE
ncbi:NAD(P)H-hydrate dehydratase [Longimicrobium sp.]|uniref:NAD(P)H-hydrate dehydratase n=1 Tax=Longimicrobium sp. TaxID=2029185 RepID=UPI002E372BFA|nr:NAD(P)H-hydrate dehydratase [Longimicrobium sp.]HEX6041498.1 NAD(P)H-hydrate dehydratase [Longimicrobium sp.]